MNVLICRLVSYCLGPRQTVASRVVFDSERVAVGGGYGAGVTASVLFIGDTLRIHNVKS